MSALDPSTVKSLPATATRVYVEPILVAGEPRFCAYDQAGRPLCIRESAEQAQRDGDHWATRGYFRGVDDPRPSSRPAGNVISF